MDGHNGKAGPATKSPGNSYQDTLDYIKNEIDELGQNHHLEQKLKNGSDLDLGSLCDTLLMIVNKEMDLTTDFETRNLLVQNSIAVSRDVPVIRSPTMMNKRLSSSHSILENNANSKTFLDAINENSSSPKPRTEFRRNRFGQKSQSFRKYQNERSHSLEWDRELNLGHSFYDNASKFSIYLADSSLIDQLLNGTSSTTFNHLQIDNGGPLLPDYIEKALIYLTKSGLNSTGIFRKSGVKSRINMLKDRISQKEIINFELSCVYDVADLVKTWLRDLKPHLLTTELIDLFGKSSKDFRLWHLDDCHRYLLYVILKFLSQVSSHSQNNQMTIQNLAICLAPSLCDADNEKQINRAQKCLQYCIENFEMLFSLTLKNNFNRQFELNSHTSVIIINASPQDILDRLLYERNVIDKLISRWKITHEKPNSDFFEFDLEFSWLLPVKTFSMKRNWNATKDHQGGLELKEISEMIRSLWIMVPNGKGQTLVKHDIALEFRGFSRKWYKTTFGCIHDKQLKCLSESFELVSNGGTNNVSSLVSQV